MEVEYMRITASSIKPNPFKKKINNGRLDQDTVKKIRANLKELGFMGSLPVVKKGDNYHLVSGHHRLAAIKQEFGKDYKVECVVHKYNDDNLLRGMVVENLTQRNNEFREELENVVLIREHLKNFRRESRHKFIKKESHRPEEPGSVRDIARWMGTENGEIISPDKIANLLSINDNLNPELKEIVKKNVVEHEKENVGVTLATTLSRVADHEEQKKLLERIRESDLTVRDANKLVSEYRQSEPEVQQAVISGEVPLSMITGVNDNKNVPRQFYQRSLKLINEMRFLRKTMTQFRKEKLYDGFTHKERVRLRDKVMTIEKEYGVLVGEIKKTVEVLAENE